MAKQGVMKLWCVLLLSVILVVFYCVAPNERSSLQIRSDIPMQQYNWQSETSNFMPTTSPYRPLVERWGQSNNHEAEERSTDVRTAICLVGGLRAFELTGPSIRKYLLDVYNDADLFIHAPLDANINKLTVLTGRPHLASVKLFDPEHLNETEIPEGLLTSSGSPNGIQGLLQYFRLVEGCLELIEDYEARHNFKYDWVIRSRVDGYWNNPMPPIDTFNASKYHVPYGSDFGGLNDRLGLGTRETSRVALQRLSLLPEIHKHGFNHLNSERSFKAQFTVNSVEVEWNAFPFCVLSKRKYRWPPGIPVASIMSKGPLHGAKCRPCTPTPLPPAESGPHLRKSARIRKASTEYLNAIGHTDEVQLCDGRKGWEQNWEQVYDAVAGPEMAELRKTIWSRSQEDCIRDMQLFQQQWDFWNAPSPEDLCQGLPARQETAPSPASS